MWVGWCLFIYFSRWRSRGTQRKLQGGWRSYRVCTKLIERQKDYCTREATERERSIDISFSYNIFCYWRWFVQSMHCTYIYDVTPTCAALTLSSYPILRGKKGVRIPCLKNRSFSFMFGPSWIWTSVDRNQRIYNTSPLTTRASTLHMFWEVFWYGKNPF